MKTPLAILFDMDGLMIDSEPVRAQSFIAIIRRHGGHVTEEIPQVIGVRVLDNWVILKNRYHLTADVATLIAEGEAEYTRLIESGMPVAMPGLDKLINHLRPTPLKRAVVSSAGLNHLQLKLQKLSLSSFFEVVVSGDMVKNGKPDPECYLLAAQKLQVSPADCLVLEDAPSGVQAAAAANMPCIAIPSRYTQTGNFSAADLILKDLSEVIPLL